MTSPSETETVIKKIIPYLTRRGYDVDTDFTFEYPASGSARANLGFVDVLVKRGGKIAFLVEAKRLAKTLADKDRQQAIGYGRDLKAPFVILTNGAQFESLNSQTGKRIQWGSKLTDKVPSKSELPAVLTALRKEPTLQLVPLAGDDSLPYRPGLALKQLNGLFARCHGTIRKIEKNEDHAFADFAKLLFLKLLEEKADTDTLSLPYSYRFFELAEKSEAEADQVKTAIISMLEAVRRKTPYGDVIQENLYLTRARTFRKIVQELAAVSFRDSRTDSKGAAFEYFVRATLKGKKLGQYFTPRPLVDVMQAMIGPKKVLNTLSLSGDMRVVDPACGTGGFLVYFMLSAIEQIEKAAKVGEVSPSRKNQLVEKLRQSVFYGADANEGVASSAKMNMIIAGDGHSNIQAEDTLASASSIWDPKTPDIDLIITNPPFGTTESDSLTADDMTQFTVSGGRGQMLFLQKMIACVKPGGEICTVIDDGLLNTEQAAALRKHILEHTYIRGIARLPDVTFKPNKINVKASVLHLQKREEPNPDMDDAYPIPFLDLQTLGYHGSGDLVRGLDFSGLLGEIQASYPLIVRSKPGLSGKSEQWSWFSIDSTSISDDATCRMDYKYWDPLLTARVSVLSEAGAESIKSINSVPTRRGKSPSASLYVDEEDGFALVIKAGTNISKQGDVVFDGDYIEKSVFDDLGKFHVQDGDILLSSTGEGTLGKAAVYRGTKPAIFDGHVTLIRVDQTKIHPEYVCDYLRAGFGAAQIARLFTGSTGLIELPPEQVDRVLIPLPKMKTQLDTSNKLRAAEAAFISSLGEAQALLVAATEVFRTL